MIQIEQITSGEKFEAIRAELKFALYPEQALPYTLSNGGDAHSICARFVAYENAEPAACLCLYTNEGVKHEGMKTIQAGNYECIDSPDIAYAILCAALSFAQENGFEFMIGPMNGSTWHNYRFKTNVVDSVNFFLEPYHQAYYTLQFLDNEFEPVANYISAIDHTMSFKNNALERIEKKLTEKGVAFRNIQNKNIENDLKKVHQLSVDAFIKNPYYTPLSWRNFWVKNKELVHKLDPRLFIIAELNEEIIGYIFSIDNYFNASEKQAVLKTLAASNKMEYRGIGFILLNKLNEYLLANNYHSLIHAYMFKENIVTRMSSKYSHEHYSSYSLFGKRV